jgi:riboflavin transporter FmnP
VTLWHILRLMNSGREVGSCMAAVAKLVVCKQSCNSLVRNNMKTVGSGILCAARAMILGAVAVCVLCYVLDKPMNIKLEKAANTSLSSLSGKTSTSTLC